MKGTCVNPIDFLRSGLPEDPGDDNEREAAIRALLAGPSSGIDPTTIPAQREAGWPDFHPEDYCHQCGRPNVVWWVDSDRWNLAVAGLERGVGTILCPPCFVTRWEKATGLRAVWHLAAESIHAVDRDPS